VPAIFFGASFYSSSGDFLVSTMPEIVSTMPKREPKPFFSGYFWSASASLGDSLLPVAQSKLPSFTSEFD